MERSKVLEEVKSYFAESDHWRRLCSTLHGETDPHGAHVHAYVDTSVDPYSIEEIITGYFERLGWPSSRKIDHLATGKGSGSLHGIEPASKPHFDFQWFYNKNIGFRAHEGGEGGCNLLAWNRWYINQYYLQYDFRDVTPEDEIILKEYFKSDHFLKGLEFPPKPITTHTHINIHSSVHPDVLQKLAEDALAREGIDIYYTCPNVFMFEGKYRGKLVFMGKNPEVVFDIAWKFDPGAVIEPAWETWFREENPGYDVWETDLLEIALEEDFVKLTEGEINDVLNECRYFKG